MMKPLLALLLLSGTAVADPVPSTITLDEAELAALDAASSDTMVEPIGRRIDRDVPVVAKLALKVGDVIRALNGRSSYGASLSLGYRGTVMYLDVIQSGKPALVRLAVKSSSTVEPLAISQLLFEAMSAVKSAKSVGVLVRQDMAPFSAGDLVRQVDGKAVATPDAFKQALVAAAKIKAKATSTTLTVERFDATLTLTVAVEADGFADRLTMGIKKVDDTHYEIQRAVLDEVLANPASFVKGARIVPMMKDGMPQGFKIYAIRPNSSYALLGLTNGDSLVSINGLELTSADKALKVYSKLRDAKQLTLELVRRGKPLTMTYTIR
ncbi:MAG: hypothetical protein NT062_05595 [Proteobacteria bacterium]|nr:hypothetical protein [Pseudomonadota bacterium]